MGKRSDFERVDRDLYETWDQSAVQPLLPHLTPHTKFVEPSAGGYALAEQLEAAGHICAHACDIAPTDPRVREGDAFNLYIGTNAIFITNPMWQRPFLHRLIVHLSDQRPTWLLLDADWAHTTQETVARKHGVQTVPELMTRCRKIVAVGRVRWIRGTKMSGKDNCCWYLLDRPDPRGVTLFFPRAS